MLLLSQESLLWQLLALSSEWVSEGRETEALQTTAWPREGHVLPGSRWCLSHVRAVTQVFQPSVVFSAELGFSLPQALGYF